MHRCNSRQFLGEGGAGSLVAFRLYKVEFCDRQFPFPFFCVCGKPVKCSGERSEIFDEDGHWVGARVRSAERGAFFLPSHSSVCGALNPDSVNLNQNIYHFDKKLRAFSRSPLDRTLLSGNLGIRFEVF